MTLGERLELRRVRAGRPSYRSLSRTLYDMLGSYAPTDESIRRLHTGKVTPEAVDLVILAALCEVYECAISDVSQVAAKRSRTASDLLKRHSRCRARTPVAA